ncbi:MULTISPECIES: hypothetical protein [unclassified Myroides]|uniref:hypothetical protein n=1 Tax=unclassified Myroides TaxID=2642485 RepID=UPI002578555B|nr:MULTISPECIES: hypothetical protein [unclassified Myroides]
MIDIESKIDELQELVSQYDTESFAGSLAFFIKKNIDPAADIEINRFGSKLKDFLYLISLNAFSDKKGMEKFEFPFDNLHLIADKLDEIKKIIYPQDLNNYTKESVIHEMAVRNHFDNGVLSYVEQDLEKLRRVFSPFDEKIISDFGFDIDFLIEVCKEIELISIIRGKQTMEFMFTKEFRDFNDRIQQGIICFSDSYEMLPEHIKKAFDSFNAKSYASLMFSSSDLYHRLDAQKVDKLLKLVSIEPVSDNSIRYYTAESIFETTPFLKLSDDNYLSLYGKQLPISIYKILYAHLFNNKSTNVKLRKHREDTLEDKVNDMFKSFFASKDSNFFENYYVIDNQEQDLLILYRGNAIIVEVKASKLREPFRDVDKAIGRLKSDFKNAIQYGFDQCKRVEDFFYSEEVFNLKNDRKKVLQVINPLNINNVFSVVVTLERFGCLQTDLGLLLEKEDDVDYPWSVYIDDLEIFLKTLQIKSKNHINNFLNFLDYRRQMHDRMYSIDELDVCACYLQNPSNFKKLAENEDIYLTFSPYEQGDFDKLYWAGNLKFNEKSLPEDFYKFELR